MEMSHVLNFDSAPEAVQIFQRLQHRFLGCVFRVLRILQDGKRRVVDTLLVRPHQFVKQLAFAAQDSDDQSCLAGALVADLGLRAMWLRSQVFFGLSFERQFYTYLLSDPRREQKLLKRF